jgi:hypothetical protein
MFQILLVTFVRYLHLHSLLFMTTRLRMHIPMTRTIRSIKLIAVVMQSDSYRRVMTAQYINKGLKATRCPARVCCDRRRAMRRPKRSEIMRMSIQNYRPRPSRPTNQLDRSRHLPMSGLDLSTTTATVDPSGANFQSVMVHRSTGWPTSIGTTNSFMRLRNPNSGARSLDAPEVGHSREGTRCKTMLRQSTTSLSRGPTRGP